MIRILIFVALTVVAVFVWLSHMRSVALSEETALKAMDCVYWSMYDYEPDFNEGASGIPGGPKFLRDIYHKHIFLSLIHI